MIETLIAVAILMISIAGPLTIAQKGLMASVYARDQVTASFLAQDAMEYVKNRRDYNTKYGVETGWLTGFDQCIDDPCVVDTLAGEIENSSGPVSEILYRGPDGYTTDETAGPASQFSRRFFLISNEANDREYRAISEVSWNNGTVSNEVRLENQMFNVNR